MLNGWTSAVLLRKIELGILTNIFLTRYSYDSSTAENIRTCTKPPDVNESEEDDIFRFFF